MNYAELYKKAQAEGTLKDIKPEFFEFSQAGKSILGKLISVSQVDSTIGGGTYNQYLFETDDGLFKFSMGGATDKDVSSLMRINGIYYVEYQGKDKISGGRSVNKFKVNEVIPPELGMVGGPNDEAF